MHRNRLKQPKIELFNLKAKHDYIPIEARNTNKNKDLVSHKQLLRNREVHNNLWRLSGRSQLAWHALLQE